MAKFYDTIPDKLIRFIQAQPVFFVATAPVAGRINLSQKGMDTFRVLDARRVAYLDLTGSGNETAAHLEENGRITVMICSFGADPLILRLYGRGRVVRPGDVAWTGLLAQFEALPGARQIMEVEVESLQTSCGFAVPEAGVLRARSTLVDWAEQKGEAALEAYRRKNNLVSIDGLPTGM